MNKPFTPLKKQQSTPLVKPMSIGSTVNVIWKTVMVTVLMLSLLLSFNTAYSQNVYCTMVCNDNLNVSVGNQCSVTIRYDQILEDGDNSITCTPNGWQAFTITVMDENLNVIPTSPTIPYEYVGRTLTVKVKHWATGNNCWASITLHDKIAPRMDCPPDISIPCTESTDPSVTGQAYVTDCGSGSNVTYEDVFTEKDCGNPIGVITRIWTATDSHGNWSKCSQTISITRPTTANVAFPPHLDGISNPAISCVSVNADANKIKPEFTGFPTINGKPITGISGDVCKLNADYEDQIIDACSGTYKILRKWTVLNWCTSEIEEAVQIIKVEDDTPPVIIVPADLTVGTQTLTCYANVPLLPATVTDACSEDIFVRITSAFNTLNSNGGTLQNVPVGTHTIVYEATDACNNTASKSIQLTVEDDDPPVVVCDDATVVSLTGDGTATVYASSFDDGTYDNCCLDKLLVRRVGDSDFGLSVAFMCSDNQVMVELQATDCKGNVNSCMVNVSIQDKVAPSIVCPPDKTIDCGVDYSDLSQFGQPTIVDNCGFDIVETSNKDLDNCGQGTITRTWTAMGSSGETTSCTQTITVINSTPWNSNNDQISWPNHYETSECITTASLDPDDLPASYNKPIFTGDDGCALIATNYEDLVLDIEPPACFKILRTWTVIDWCVYDINTPGSAGRYEFEQIIKVIDNSKPNFGVEPADFTIDMLDQICGGTVTIPNVGVTDCSPNATVTAQGALGSGFGPFSDVMPGIYDMQYIATDGCGNTISKDVKITVRDAVKPTPICNDGLTITLMPSSNGNPPSVELWAKDLDAKSYDNCSADSDLEFRIRRYDANENTAPGTANITFKCEDKGVQQVEVWVIDQNGNADYCLTNVTVQDNSNVCGSNVNPDDMITLSGKITTEMGDAVSDVSVQISHPDKAPYLTGNDGTFSYEQLPGDLDYALIPEKDIEPKNGVSTLDIIKMRKHIIGLEPFDSPYKVIAGDVDRSGTISTIDLIQIRKLILGLIEDFPNNESWRFIPVGHEFENSLNPLLTDFPEIAIVAANSENKTAVDFMAIKTGDVDYSAQTNGWTAGESRTTGTTLLLDLKNQNFEAGETVNVTFQANNFTQVLGYQFEMIFNKEVIDYQLFNTNLITNLSVDNLGLTHVENGIIKTSWDAMEAMNIEDGGALFTLQFKAKKAGQLSEVISINPRGLAAQLYTQNEEIFDLKLNFKEQTPIVDKVELAQNQPNPFNAQTTIQFTLARAQKATLTIFDVNGKILKQYANDFAQGHHRIEVSKTDLPTVGLMYYALETAEERIVRKMILLNQ